MKKILWGLLICFFIQRMLHTSSLRMRCAAGDGGMVGDCCLAEDEIEVPEGVSLASVLEMLKTTVSRDNYMSRALSWFLKPPAALPIIVECDDESSLSGDDDELVACCVASTIASTDSYLNVCSDLSVHFSRLDALMKRDTDGVYIKQMKVFVTGISTIPDVKMQLLVRVLQTRYPQIMVK